MARSRYCKACYGWHSTEEPWPQACFDHWPSRSAGAQRVSFYVRTDGMEPMRSLADGLTYDSKSAYYASVRRAGCEIIGDDTSGFRGPPGYEPGDIAGDIKRTIAELSR